MRLSVIMRWVCFSLGLAILGAWAGASGADSVAREAKTKEKGAAEIASPSPSPSEPAQATRFVRFVEDAKGAFLQTGIGSYVSPEGAEVDLVGAIHIADKSYYEALNRRFKTYEAVLYELVGRPVEERVEMKPGDGDDRLRWLGQLQETMRTSLALESQLRGIDYEAPNFVHADMSLEGFFASQEKKKESFIGLWWKAVKAQGFLPDSGRAQPGLGKILEVLCRKDSATELKRVIGREFDAVEQVVAGIEADGGSAIIGERNKHALEVLSHEIKNGKRRLAVFYGAAHLPDMEARLFKKGYKVRKPAEWLSAWTLPPEPPPLTGTAAGTSASEGAPAPEAAGKAPSDKASPGKASDTP